MNYKLLGKSGLRVSELALGTMTFGEDWGWGASKEECKKMFDAFSNAGGNFIDTANNYTNSTAEKLVGEFTSSDREHFVIATKYTLNMRKDDPNFGGNHKKNMVQSIEASLKRLKTDYIDLYWLHAWDFTTSIEEVMRGLDDLIRAGKVLYIGVSDTPAWVVSKANTLAELRGWTQFIALQLQYSLIERNIERELLPMARSLDLGVTPWGALGRGILSGKYNRNKNAEGRASMYGQINERDLKISQEVVNVAEQVKHSPSQVALSWVRQQPGVIVPIIGAKNLDQFKDNLGCLEFTLNTEQLIKLDEVSKIDLGFPYSFVESDMVKELIFGGTYSKIQNHRKI